MKDFDKWLKEKGEDFVNRQVEHTKKTHGESAKRNAEHKKGKARSFHPKNWRYWAENTDCYGSSYLEMYEAGKIDMYTIWNLLFSPDSIKAKGKFIEPVKLADNYKSMTTEEIHAQRKQWERVYPSRHGPSEDAGDDEYGILGSEVSPSEARPLQRFTDPGDAGVVRESTPRVSENEIRRRGFRNRK